MTVHFARYLFPQFICAAVLAVAHAAQAQHFDALFMDQGGKLVATGFDDTFLTYSSGTLRVFEGDIDPTEPGMQSQTQAELDAAFGAGTFNALPPAPPGADLNFDLLPISIGGADRNLWFWPGGGAVSFGEPTVNSLTLTHPISLNTATVNGGGSTVGGFTVDTTDANGVLHQHLESSVAVDTDGFYLLAAQFEMAGLLDPDPIFYVLANGTVDEEDHEAAVSWVVDNLVDSNQEAGGAIPEPSAALLFALGILAVSLSKCRTNQGARRA